MDGRSGWRSLRLSHPEATLPGFVVIKELHGTHCRYQLLEIDLIRGLKVYLSSTGSL